MASGLENIETIESPFRRFVTTIGVFPTAFTDAMTYYECLAYLVKYLEDSVVPAVNENAEALKELQDYVVHYFDNLDVQDEINNKLDEMAEDGTLQEIITAYIQANVAWTFDTVADMKASTNLIAGSFAQTLGFHAIGDGGNAIYKISDEGTADEASIIAVGALKAHLVITGDIKPEQFGAYGDGTHNDSTAFIKCLDYVKSLESTLNNEVIGETIVLTNDYLIDKISIPQGMALVRMIGKKARIRTGGFTFNGSTGWKVRFEGIIFDHCETPIDFDYRNLEYGRYEIVDCIFRTCTGTAINVERRSCQVSIEKCTFRGCAKSVYANDVDMLIFKDNWLECTNDNPWGDNHYDIEQYAPNEGTMIIENNMFIPGYTQTGTNPCWIKVGRNAVIKNNRFSGENASIHPVIIMYDNYASFNVTSTIYPIVDFVDNPIVTGNTRILVDGSARGTINVKNNSGWAGGLPIMDTSSASATTALEALDYRYLVINFEDNGGRSFNFRNDYGTSLPTAYKPSVAVVLQRFIKDKTMYQEEYYYELKSSVTNYVLNIEYCTTDLKRVNTIAISGTVNKNPSGTDYYEPFIGLLTLERYYDTELRYRGHLQIITKNNQNVSFDVLVNGQAYITALPSGENVKFTVSGNGNARPIFKSVEVLHFKPIANSMVN